MKTVADLMITKLQVLHDTHSVADAREVMRLHNIRNIPVVGDDGHTFKGIVSQRDILKESFRIVSEHGMSKLAELERQTVISSVMATDVITTAADTALTTAGRYCMENKHGCLPVLDDQGQLLGIVTPSDFVRLCVQLLEQSSQDHQLSGSSR